MRNKPRVLVAVAQGWLEDLPPFFEIGLCVGCETKIGVALAVRRRPDVLSLKLVQTLEYVVGFFAGEFIRGSVGITAFRGDIRPDQQAKPGKQATAAAVLDRLLKVVLKNPPAETSR